VEETLTVTSVVLSLSPDPGALISEILSGKTNECFFRLFFSRGLFHTAVRIMLVLDVMAIVLFLIWLCLVSCPESHFALHFAPNPLLYSLIFGYRG
jgi:hypothetical protein